jgi:hypothetical protein
LLGAMIDFKCIYKQPLKVTKELKKLAQSLQKNLIDMNKVGLTRLTRKFKKEFFLEFSFERIKVM